MSDEAIAIDPPDCGCTECLTGEYVPLDRATNEQIQRMIAGELADHTGIKWRVTRRVEFSAAGLGHRVWTVEDNPMAHGKPFDPAKEFGIPGITDEEVAAFHAALNETATSRDLEQVKRLLHLCADGRREYAQRAPHPSKEHLEIEANTFENAIKILEGDQAILYSLLPSWRWDDAGLPDPG